MWGEQTPCTLFLSPRATAQAAARSSRPAFLLQSPLSIFSRWLHGEAALCLLCPAERDPLPPWTCLTEHQPVCVQGRAGLRRTPGAGAWTESKLELWCLLGGGWGPESRVLPSAHPPQAPRTCDCSWNPGHRKPCCTCDCDCGWNPGGQEAVAIVR